MMSEVPKVGSRWESEEHGLLEVVRVEPRVFYKYVDNSGKAGGLDWNTSVTSFNERFSSHVPEPEVGKWYAREIDEFGGQEFQQFLVHEVVDGRVFGRVKVGNTTYAADFRLGFFVSDFEEM